MQMEKVTQTTAASAEESASASQELAAQSDTLRSIVVRLNGMVGGGGDSGIGRPVREPKRAVSQTTPAGPRVHTVASQRHGAPYEASEPALAAAHAVQNAFPLEDDFKEF